MNFTPEQIVDEDFKENPYTEKETVTFAEDLEPDREELQEILKHGMQLLGPMTVGKTDQPVPLINLDLHIQGYSLTEVILSAGNAIEKGIKKTIFDTKLESLKKGEAVKIKKSYDLLTSKKEGLESLKSIVFKHFDRIDVTDSETAKKSKVRQDRHPDDYTHRLLIASKKMGTHTDKIADSKNSIGTLIADFTLVESASVYGATIGKVQTNRTLLGAGNGADNSLYRFLSWTIVDNGDILSLAEAFSKSNYEKELQESFPEFASEFKKIGEQVLKSNFEISLDANNRTVFVPYHDGSYMSVTPLTNMVLMAEMNKRIALREYPLVTEQKPEGKNHKIEQERFFMKKLNVGGTKSQNSGLLASDVGGKIPRFQCFPPTSNGSEQKNYILSNLLKREFVFKVDFVSRKLLTDFENALKDTRDNQDSRYIKSHNLKRIIQVVCSDFERLNDIQISEDKISDKNRDIAVLFEIVSGTRLEFIEAQKTVARKLFDVLKTFLNDNIEAFSGSDPEAEYLSSNCFKYIEEISS